MPGRLTVSPPCLLNARRIKTSTDAKEFAMPVTSALTHSPFIDSTPLSTPKQSRRPQEKDLQVGAHIADNRPLTIPKQLIEQLRQHAHDDWDHALLDSILNYFKDRNTPNCQLHWGSRKINDDGGSFSLLRTNERITAQYFLDFMRQPEDPSKMAFLRVRDYLDSEDPRFQGGDDPKDLEQRAARVEATKSERKTAGGATRKRLLVTLPLPQQKRLRQDDSADVSAARVGSPSGKSPSATSIPVAADSSVAARMQGLEIDAVPINGKNLSFNGPAERCWNNLSTKLGRAPTIVEFASELKIPYLNEKALADFQDTVGDMTRTFNEFAGQIDRYKNVVESASATDSDKRKYIFAALLFGSQVFHTPLLGSLDAKAKRKVKTLAFEIDAWLAVKNPDRKTLGREDLHSLRDRETLNPESNWWDALQTALFPSPAGSSIEVAPVNPEISGTPALPAS
jgi:hypothetical protein